MLYEEHGGLRQGNNRAEKPNEADTFIIISFRIVVFILYWHMARFFCNGIKVSPKNSARVASMRLCNVSWVQFLVFSYSDRDSVVKVAAKLRFHPLLMWQPIVHELL